MTTEIVTSSNIDTSPITIPFEDIDSQDGEHFAHIVNPAMNLDIQRQYGKMDARQIVDTARFLGIEIIALCTKKFVPKHDPGPLPACEKCMEIAGMIIQEDG